MSWETHGTGCLLALLFIAWPVRCAEDPRLVADADVLLTNELGVMPLAFACETGDGAMVQKLLAAGANPNVALRPGDTPLMLATRSGGPEAVKALLAHGAAVNTKSMAKGQTALMWAAPKATATLFSC